MLKQGKNNYKYFTVIFLKKTRMRKMSSKLKIVKFLIIYKIN